MSKILVMYSNGQPSPGHVERLEKVQQDVSVVVADSEEMAIRHAADTDIILGHRYLRQTLPYVQHLKWVQSTAAGPHHLLSSDLRRVNPILSRCTAFSDAIAWHAFTLALSVVRRIPEAVKAQQQGVWAHSHFNMLPFPKTAMVFGVGRIGRELAMILRRNGLSVLGVTRKYSPEASAACDELFCDYNSWFEQLHRADLCFITLPLTKYTSRFFDETILRALPKHAVLVNMGRGGVVDTEALVRLLQEGHLGGAALDVVDPVPSSSSDPVWTAPRLLITPKVAVFHPEHQKKLEAFIENQVTRYFNGETLLDLITINDLAEGN
ncbi:phosphoglycerate dehydrogenase-like enzyme [Nitrosospira sp. Nsp5]|uniref:Phosphoglycerate dehydrogenase n=1 Tax=Nitrosospira multiformis TaxID=1231 RepID=A0ABY0T5H4_9PROT|nr:MULTISPECIES: NAD(P)-dependent oxidoreductase [Nitrosospira]PTR09653.1 phosphoglycerate dehydrogenase-like enzyme [Nitrosospira sp. Nsp5]SDQ25339.1 Phosphoglycerate dehydrogenase [Nitrosospira multiformis]